MRVASLRSALPSPPFDFLIVFCQSVDAQLDMWAEDEDKTDFIWLVSSGFLEPTTLFRAEITPDAIVCTKMKSLKGVYDTTGLAVSQGEVQFDASACTSGDPSRTRLIRTRYNRPLPPTAPRCRTSWLHQSQSNLTANSPHSCS